MISIAPRPVAEHVQSEPARRGWRCGRRAAAAEAEVIGEQVVENPNAPSSIASRTGPIGAISSAFAPRSNAASPMT